MKKSNYYDKDKDPFIIMKRKSIITQLSNDHEPCGSVGDKMWEAYNKKEKKKE